MSEKKKTEKSRPDELALDASKVTDLSQIRLGLSRMNRLLNLLGDPENQLSIIHIAGTNGKGSTLSFLREILLQAGIRVGTFSSPAVFDPYEVITLNGRKITATDFEATRQEVDLAASQMQEDLPTPFERLTAQAYLYLAKEKAQIALIETGLGGDSDSTNCYGNNQICSVITSIGMDHCDFLGHSLTEIAGHKAGIFRPGRPVCIGIQQAEANQVLKASAKALNCPIYSVKKSRLHLEKQETMQFTYGSFPKVSLKVLGKFQQENASLALETVLALREAGYEISDQACKNGLEQMEMPGRAEMFSLPYGENCWMLLDGAHNPPAAKRLRELLNEKPLKHALKYIICGVYADKDYKEVLHTVLGGMEETIKTVSAVELKGARALPAQTLCQTIREESLLNDDTKLLTYKEVKDAVADGLCWLQQQKKPALVLAFGSLSWLKEARQMVCKERKNMDKKKIEEGVRLILEGIGEDVEREGLQGTPDRIARMYEEILSGYSEDPAVPLSKQFSACGTDVILEKDIVFYSLCEHHMVPFYGKAHVAYIPTDRVVGLSKLARVVEIFAKRLQLQERLTAQIADAIMKELNTLGVMVVIEAEHMCMTMRGVKKPGSKTVTYVTRGRFAEDSTLVDRVLTQIR